MLDCAWNVELEVELTADTASLDVTVLSSFGVGCGVVVAVRTAVFGSTVVVECDGFFYFFFQKTKLNGVCGNSRLAVHR